MIDMSLDSVQLGSCEELYHNISCVSLVLFAPNTEDSFIILSDHLYSH
jgi:hypothetical protein